MSSKLAQPSSFNPNQLTADGLRSRNMSSVSNWSATSLTLNPMAKNRVRALSGISVFDKSPRATITK